MAALTAHLARPQPLLKAIIKRVGHVISRFCGWFLFAPARNAAQAATPDAVALTEVDKIFADWRLSAHVPRLVYGIVADGKLVHLKSMGVQDTANNAPVTPDSLFRIASMSKAFTALAILKLRDDGKLSLDTPAERYIPQLKAWRYPTSDSPG
jgi:CubicO group peptidase (beta-lactamase class C family)